MDQVLVLVFSQLGDVLVNRVVYVTDALIGESVL
jgi:hypothetical protein